MQKTEDRQKFCATLRELAAAGCVVDLSVAEASKENLKVEINQTGGITDSTLFDLPDTRAGYILDVEIMNNTSRAIYCSEVELRMPWDDTSIRWLPDPKEQKHNFPYFLKRVNGKRERVQSTYDLYSFRGGSQLEYPRNLVLNHLLSDGGALPSRRPVRGLFLATGAPMPRDLCHGSWIDATLTIFASDHSEYIEAIRLWVERLEIKAKSAAPTQKLFALRHRSDARGHIAR